jgi:hypothetical protein
MTISVQEQLQERAFLHDDPGAYLAGVADAVSVLTEAEPRIEEPAADEATTA